MQSLLLCSITSQMTESERGHHISNIWVTLVLGKNSMIAIVFTIDVFCPNARASQDRNMSRISWLCFACHWLPSLCPTSPNDHQLSLDSVSFFKLCYNPAMPCQLYLFSKCVHCLSRNLILAVHKAKIMQKKNHKNHITQPGAYEQHKQYLSKLILVKQFTV